MARAVLPVLAVAWGACGASSDDENSSPSPTPDAALHAGGDAEPDTTCTRAPSGCDAGNTVDAGACDGKCSPGAILWTQTYATPFADWAYAVATDTHDDIVITGPDLLQKYAASGELLWTKQGVAGQGIAINAQGQIYVTGGAKLQKFTTDGSLLWTEQYESSSPLDVNVRYAVAIDPDGNAIVAGVETRAELQPFQYSNIWVAKYSPEGERLWSSTYNNPTNWDDEARGVAVDGAGDVYVTGYEMQQGTGRSLDFWTGKFSAKGEALWVDAHNSSVSLADMGQAITVDPQGKVIAAGGSMLPTWGILLRKYHPSGLLEWSVRQEDDLGGEAMAWGVATDAASNPLVVGSMGQGEHTDVWVGKFNPSGELVWSDRYDSPAQGIDQALGVATDSADNVIVVGVEERKDLGQDFNVWLRKYAP